MPEGRVKQHIRKTKGGKTSVVKEHGRDDKRVKKPLKKSIKKNTLLKDTGLYNEHVKKLSDLEGKKGSKVIRFHTLQKIPEGERSSEERLEFAKLRHSLGVIDKQIRKEKLRVAAYKSKFPEIGKKKKSKTAMTKPTPEKLKIPKKVRTIPKKTKEKPKVKEKPKGWKPPTQRKGSYTTPDEARKLNQDYKKSLKDLKKIVGELGLEKAKKNEEYIAIKAVNKARIKKYKRIVSEHKKSLESGEKPKEEPKKPVKKDPKHAEMRTKFHQRLEMNTANIAKGFQKVVFKKLVKMFEGINYGKYKNINELWNEKFKEIDAEITKWEDKALISAPEVKMVKDLIKSVNKLETYRAFFLSKDGKSLKFQPKLSYTGDDAAAIIRLENIEKIEDFFQTWSAAYRHKIEKMKGKAKPDPPVVIPSDKPKSPKKPKTPVKPKKKVVKASDLGGILNKHLKNEAKKHKTPKVRDRKAILKEIATLRVDVKVAIKHGDKTNTAFLNAKIAKLMKEAEKL